MASRYWIRAFYTALTSDESVASLLEFCKRAEAHGALLLTHSFDTEPGLLDRDELQKRAARLREIVPAFRDAGLEVHINVMSTLGHGAPTVNTVAELGFSPMIDHLGHESDATPCPLDPAFLEYVAELYGHMAQTGASALWVDDDVRYNGHGTPGIGCFCPRHLERVGAKLGQDVTREEFVERIESPEPVPTPERMAWMEANNAAMREMAETIRRAVDAVDAGIELGLMTVGYMSHAAEGRQTPELLRTLCPDGTRWFRPGPGFWTDERPLELVRKTEDCHRQSILAGDGVRPVSEVENYPYSQATKSLQLLHLELSLNALSGFPDQSLNLFDALGGVDCTDPGYDAFLADEKPWLDALADATDGMTRRGIGLAADEHVGWFLPLDGSRRGLWSVPLARLGLPLGEPDSAPHFLSDAMAAVVAPEEVEAMVAEGLIMDGPAAERLVARGLGALVGLTGVRRLDVVGYERLTDDPLNGDMADRLLGMRHGAPEAGLYALEPSTSAGRVLSRMLAMNGANFGAGAVVTQMDAGGRVAALPYGLPTAWAFASQARQAQMHAICSWVADGALPAAVRCTPNLYPIVWANADDTKRVVAVANLSYDVARKVPVVLDSTPWALDTLVEPGQWKVSEALGYGDELVVTVQPWDVAVRRLLRA